MTDLDLFGFGCAVSFVALGGVYVYLRERFAERGEQEQQRQLRAVPIVDRQSDRAA